MKYARQSARPFFSGFDKQVNGNTLHDVKYIFVRGAVRRGFFFAGVAVQIKNVNLVKSLEQGLSHLPVRDAFEKTVIRDVSKNTLPGFLHNMLAIANELDVVVIKIQLFLFQALFVFAQQILYPRPPVAAA
ncbi:MAG: hypothetical protein MPK75_12185, partial [Alphaproteobacteria bacterium]|nr:hypothetical protein [Alphaproteobacteria bacterium]